MTRVGTVEIVEAPLGNEGVLIITGATRRLITILCRQNFVGCAQSTFGVS
jgi:hypothetical protein